MAEGSIYFSRWQNVFIFQSLKENSKYNFSLFKEKRVKETNLIF